MKIFEQGEAWHKKINFVDENNVLVGFDYGQSCCEDFGYFFSQKIPPHQTAPDKEIDFDPAGWVFDTTYFEDRELGDYDGKPAMTIFRLVKNDEEMYLALYNLHNGYYGHGFDMEIDGKSIHSGNL